jgi:ketosteroid isomerase-like protein
MQMSAVAGTRSPLPFRAAVEARDLAALVEAFAPDAVVRGPTTDRAVVQGRDRIAELYEVNFQVLEDLRCTDELRDGDSAVLLARARVDGTEIQIADHLLLDEQGRVRELTVFVRPTPALAVATRAIGSAIARRKSPLRGRIASLLAAPLVLYTRFGDKFAERTVGSSGE